MATKTDDGSTLSATAKAHTTGRWAETMFRALSARVAKRWQFISFRGSNKGEWRGIVDLIAIRKSTSQPESVALKRGDLFDIVLVQVKGGTSRPPTLEDRRRLKAVAEHYRARDVVQFCWKREQQAEFSVLQDDLSWRPTTGKEVFG